MKLGFSVEALLPLARVNGPLRLGLARLGEDEWLQPDPDLAVRGRCFDAYPGSVIVLPQAHAAGEELAAMLGVAGGLEASARGVWEDLCILTRNGDDAPLLLTGGAVAFPTDWRLADKIGKPLLDVHAPIHGYAGQLSAGVDSFMDGLRPGAIFGRTNAFVVPSAMLRYLPEEVPAVRFAYVTRDNAGARLFVRCERQTLRRLPETGAIVFTIGIYRCRLDMLSGAAVTRIAASLDGYGEGETGRRAMPCYAEALAGYARTRDAGDVADPAAAA